MNTKLVLAAAFLALAPRAWAQADSSNDAPVPAAETASKPAKEALPGLESPAKAEASCLVPGPAANALGCAGAYRVVADAYLAAYKAMDVWLSAASIEVSGAADRLKKLEQSVRDNETAMTALKLDRSKDAKLKLKDLDKSNKQLWKDLEAARANEATICKGFSKSAAQKVKDLSMDVAAKLAQAQKAGL